VQGDAFNASRLATVVVVPLTSNLQWASAPGNVLFSTARTGLPRDAVDRMVLTERVGRISTDDMQLLLSGIDLVLGRE
jgi:mRNA interferase MazF